MVSKEGLKGYAQDVLGLVKVALASKPVKFALAGMIVGFGMGAVVGVPVIGMYLGFGVGAYQGITAS